MESIEAVVTACHHFDGGFVHLPPGERHRMESIKAVDTACYHYDGLRKLRHRAAPRRAATHREHQGSRLPHSGAVGNALGASRQRTIHATTTTRGRTSWHRAAGRVAVHGEHRGRGYCLSSLRQGVVRRVIVPPVGWQRMENIEAVGTSCHHYDRGSYVVASRRRSGGNAWRTSRQRVLPVIIRQRVVRRGIAPQVGWQLKENIEAEDTACHHYDRGSYVVASSRLSGGSVWRTSRQRVLPAITTTGGRTSWHRATGRVAAHGEHRGRGYRLSPL